MKFLIDECVLADTAVLLRKNGFAVVTVQELGKASATNGAVVTLANQERTVLITNDLDMADLRAYPIASHRGLILLRPRLDTLAAVDDVHKILLRALKEIPGSELEKSLVIVDRTRYRVRRSL